MLGLRVVRFKNFLSTGNTFTEIQLDKYPHTLMIGPNGAGKTTLLDSLCFGLYGKPFRNINKPKLVNTINQKQLLVEVEFSTQGNNYLVRRGMKPTVFEIICNGDAIKELPSVVEMQDYLEKYILKCNFKAFTQVVILGSSSYVPFMRLTPQARRDILEDVLDIEIFSAMHAILKDKLVTVKDSLAKAQTDLYLSESQHALVKTYTEKWEAQQEEKRNSLQRSIESNVARTEKTTTELEEAKTKLSQYEGASTKLDELRAKHTKAKSLVAKFNNEVQHLSRNHTFFVDNDQCPTCTQEIGPEFKQEKCQSTEALLEEAQKNRDEVKDIVASLERRIAKAQTALTEHNSITFAIHKLESELGSLAKELAQLQSDLEHTNDPPPAPPEDLGDPVLRKQEVDTLTQEKHVLDQGNLLLKDTGIRTKIIAQYLPVINKWVNHYLASLDFPIQFTLDEQFNETIKSRFRDDFTYESFSDGEKRRIDLALVLTWRAVARLKNSVYTNLLIFDEVFDGSLDVAGTEEFMRVLHTLDKGTNVFVISHKDAMTDKFSNVLTATKVKGFSQITQP